VSFIQFRQQFHVGGRVAAREPIAPVRLLAHAARCGVLAQKSGHLCPAQSRHLRHVSAEQSLGGAILFPVLLSAQRPLHPAIHLPAFDTFKLHFIGRLQQRPDLFQAQSF
jgi:hypothetical protein